MPDFLLFCQNSSKKKLSENMVEGVRKFSFGLRECIVRKTHFFVVPHCFTTVAFIDEEALALHQNFLYQGRSASYFAQPTLLACVPKIQKSPREKAVDLYKNRLLC